LAAGVGHSFSCSKRVMMEQARQQGNNCNCSANHELPLLLLLPPRPHTLHVEKNKSKHKQIYPRASSGRASTATRFSALIVSLPARNEVRYLPKVRRRVADDHAR